MGPLGKVLCGFAVSAALLIGGVWLERKPVYRIFARAGIGGGWALCFFTTFAMHHLPAALILHSLGWDLVLMLIVAAGMVAHSLRYRSQTVTGLAFGLGYLTLITSHLESASGTVVFSLAASAVLALALVTVTTLRHWAWLELAGLIAVYATHFVWLTQILPDNHADFTEFWPSAALIVVYWLIFRLAYVFRTPLNQNEENISSLSAILNASGVLALLKYQSVHPEWAFWALAALGVLEMVLAFTVRSRRRQAFVVLSTIATVLLVSAVPFKFHGVSWPVLWLVESQVLAISGLRLGEPVFRRLGLLAGVLTGCVLALHDVLPFLILRIVSPDPGGHTSLTVALALAALLYWLHAEVYPRRWPKISENEIEAYALRITSWLGAAAAVAALWVALPDQWLPIGWLALALLLAFAAQRFSAANPLLQADALALLSAFVLIIHHVIPLVFFRIDNPDPSRHLAETVVLTLAAIAYWLHSEVYPRILPRIPAGAFDLAPWLGFVIPAFSFLGAAAAGAALWVALPDLWVAIGWLVLALLLSLAAHRLSGPRLSLEADVLALISVVALFLHPVLPLALYRLDNPDPSRHLAETSVLGLAALAYWIRAELLRRILPSITGDSPNQSAGQPFMLALSSWLGTAAASAALWAVVPAPWLAVGWLALVLLLGLVADWIKAEGLALQADLLAVCALVGLFVWDFLGIDGFLGNEAPLAAAVALLYAGMRRKTVLAGSPNYVPSAYSWAATILLGFLANDLSSYVFTAILWAALGLALFEIGRLARKGFLRWQGVSLVGLASFRYLAIDLPDLFSNGLHKQRPGMATEGFSLTFSLILEVLVLVASGYWLLERTRDSERCGRGEYKAGLLMNALGTLSVALWFAYRFPSYWVPVWGGDAWVTAIWAGMATVRLAFAWLMRRRTFVLQAVALAVAVVVRAIALDLIGNFWQRPLLHLGIASALLLAALPFAFQLRKPGFFSGASAESSGPFAAALRCPEQWFFFAPFGLMVLALALKLTSGHITIAWSLMGVGVFLFALIVGERSFRLAGLALLLLSVVKILLMDVWQLSPSDRYITLIVLGVALLVVSFLYTRFSAVIRRYL
jgi:hypothetical protein